MAAIAAGPDVAVKWMPGSLDLHEEFAGAISEPSPGRRPGRSSVARPARRYRSFAQPWQVQPAC